MEGVLCALCAASTEARPAPDAKGVASVVKASTRRRARLRSSQYASERWKPSPILLILLAGLAVGVFVGLRGRLSGNTDSLQEHYLLLVSDLYAQGTPLTAVRDRLVAVGYANPSVSVLAVADQLATSRDAIKQQEADQLRLFSDALATGAEHEASNAVAAGTESKAESTPSTSASATPSAAGVAPPGSGPVSAAATATVAPAATPIAIPTTTAGSPPIITPSSSGGSGHGVIESTDRKPVIVRKEATTKSPSLAIAPYGAAVTVKGTVQGEAVDAGDARWYQVSYNGKDGYIYAQLVKVGG